MIDIIIPTYDSPNLLLPCLDSIFASSQAILNKVIVVNNGHEGLKEVLPNRNRLQLLQMEQNVGWEGGLIAGLKESSSPFVIFMNDDVHILPFSGDWLQKMVVLFRDSSIGAVGPSTNVVMGLQNIFASIPYSTLEVTYLIGFCMMVKREVLDSVGGVDDTLPGGDDLDLSIRIRKAGKRLIVRRDSFIYHHGFQTGKKVFGARWNSQEMTDETNHALIRKHGLREFYECVTGWRKVIPAYPSGGYKDLRDIEGKLVRKYLNPGRSLELGCGSTKTVPDSVGIDLIPKSQLVPFLNGETSVAGIVGDVEQELPIGDKTFDNVIARHILEHCIDPVKALKIWVSALSTKGRLILAVPDHRIGNTIPMNPQHVHGFTPESLDNLVPTGMVKVGLEENFNGVSFVGVYEKA